MAYGTVNADVIGTSVAGSNLGAGNASIMKNRIINGAMAISQRNGTSSVSITAANQYTLDRWQVLNTQSSKLTVAQSTTAPTGFSNSLLATSSSAYTQLTSDSFGIAQVIEGFNMADLGWGTASAKTVTLSFWVQSSLTGTFGGSLINGAFNYSYPFSYTISAANTWEQKSITIAGPTAGTWVGAVNTAGIYLSFGLGGGASASGTAGAWTATAYYNTTGATNVLGTNGATLYITGVQLEVGSNATGFEYVNYQTSLANCQRYYETFARLQSGVTGSTNTNYGTVGYKVTKRATPTVAYSLGYSTVSAINTESTIFTRTGDPVDFTSLSFSAEL